MHEPWYVRKARLAQQHNPQKHPVQLEIGGIMATLEEVANKIQEAKLSAFATTAECARDNEWDLETYYRAKAEGLAEAESIVRAEL